MGSIFWLFRRIWSVFWLGSGVLLLISTTSALMGAFVVPTLVAIGTGNAGGYVKDIWLVFDKLWNAILLGDRDETFSSRLGKIYHYNAPTRFPEWFVHRLVWMLDKVDSNHCKNSIDWNHGWVK